MLQPLNRSTGLSFAIIADGMYYIIPNQMYDQKDVQNLKAMAIPEEFRSPFGLLLYDNRRCDSKNYSLFVYYMQDINSQAFDWYITLNLIDWTPTRKWTKKQRGLYDILDSNPYMNYHPMTFTMYWHSRRSLIIVQMPAEGAPENTKDRDYHTIFEDKSCPKKKYNYFVDNQMKFVEVLDPYQDYDSCFIHDDKQIICIGPKNFTTYYIDLDKSQNGIIRVYNHSKDIPNLPLIAFINKICGYNITKTTTTIISTTSPANTLTSPTVVISTSLDTTTAVNNSSQDVITTERHKTTTSETEENTTIPIWIFILLILIAIIILAFIIIWCFKNSKDKQKQKQLSSPKTGDKTQSPNQELNNTSLYTNRSQISGTTRRSSPEMSTNSSLSTRSHTRGLSNQQTSSIINLPEMATNSSLSTRSRTGGLTDPRNKLKQTSSIVDSNASNVSTRSQTNTKNLTNKLPNDGAIDNDLIDENFGSTIDTNVSMRSQNNPKT